MNTERRSIISNYLYLNQNDIITIKNFIERLEKYVIRFDKKYITQELFILSYINTWKNRIPLKVSNNPFSFNLSLLYFMCLFKLDNCDFNIALDFVKKVISLCNGWELIQEKPYYMIYQTYRKSPKIKELYEAVLEVLKNEALVV
ncbi:MAG: hypothetical protein QXF86_03115 [Candidatus Bilamarchaeaceae archaeon]